MANKNKVGLLFGVLLGGFHLMWALLVWLGWAAPLFNFVLWAHMISWQIGIGPFDPTAATTLVLMTFVIGYVVGWVGEWVWNRLHRA